MKRPAFQFYPADWRKDAALQSCSMAAQGLWINLMCIAHECEPYGHLVVNGKPMQAAQIARLVGLSGKECERLLSELVDAGVCAVGDDGAFYSRRMVRDEDLRNRRSEGGKAGSEFGHLGAEHGSKGGRPRKETGDKKPPLEPPPSSSSSSSTSVNSEAIASEGARKPRPARKCPADFAVTADMRDWAAASAPLVDVDTATAAFRDHTFKTAMTDWTGAWRNWLRRDQQHFAERQKPTRRAPVPENFAGVNYGESGLL